MKMLRSEVLRKQPSLPFPAVCKYKIINGNFPAIPLGNSATYFFSAVLLPIGFFQCFLWEDLLYWDEINVAGGADVNSPFSPLHVQGPVNCSGKYFLCSVTVFLDS